MTTIRPWCCQHWLCHIWTSCDDHQSENLIFYSLSIPLKGRISHCIEFIRKCLRPRLAPHWFRLNVHPSDFRQISLKVTGREINPKISQIFSNISTPDFTEELTSQPCTAQWTVLHGCTVSYSRFRPIYWLEVRSTKLRPWVCLFHSKVKSYKLWHFKAISFPL